MGKHASVIPTAGLADRRDVREVPFVELAGGRVQGVVSSGSDIAAGLCLVRASPGPATTTAARTTTGRAAGSAGLRASTSPTMVDEAILQFGAAAVAAYLGVSGDGRSVDDAPQRCSGLLRARSGRSRPGVVFSRFLNYLRYCELRHRPGTVLEMSWFVS